MRDFFKNKVVTVLILAATLILAGIAIFTAIRLYQLRQQAVAPTAPTKPKAAAPQACSPLSFTVSAATLGPTPTPTATAKATASPAATATATAKPTTKPTAGPTSGPSLPSSGTSWPTLVGIGVGALLIIGAIVLAI